MTPREEELTRQNNASTAAPGERAAAAKSGFVGQAGLWFQQRTDWTATNWSC
jgi:hypothetical protein